MWRIRRKLVNVLPAVVVLGTWQPAGAQSAAPRPCGCYYVDAYSEAATGVCHVNEDMASDCAIIWGPTAGATQAFLGLPVDSDAVVREAREAAAAAPTSSNDYLAASLKDLGSPDSDFWPEFTNAMRDRSELRDANLYVQSLTFLSMKDVVSKEPQFTVGALVIVVTTGLREKLPNDPAKRGAILQALLGNRDRFLAFSEEQGQYAGKFGGDVQIPGATPDLKASMSGFVGPGCFEFSIDSLKLAQLIKAQWSLMRGGGCQ